MTKQQKNIKKDFFLVLCKQQNKLTKYFKLNKIAKKVVIDIRKMLNEENLTYDEALTQDFFKLLIFKKIKYAKDTNKDIYYIPIFTEKTNSKDVLNVKDYINDKFDFNLLCFYDDFNNSNEVSEVLDNIHEFNFVQLLEDY